MSKELIISPVSIDLGAKNTGVYFAHYPAGSPLEDIEKEGKVYQLEKDKYTLLMANRTAARHQRRGYDRRQMAKRLFKLIWEKHFGLEWDGDVQQTIGFLMNRRGFSFLTEEYKPDVLRQFPQEAYKLLPEKLQDDQDDVEQNEDSSYDFASVLEEWAREGKEKTKSMFDALDKEPRRIWKELSFIRKTKKLQEYCSRRSGNPAIPEEKKANLSKLPVSILKKWDKEGIQDLPTIPLGNSIDMVAYINKIDTTTAKRMLESIPTNYASEKKVLEESIWNFNAVKFESEKADFTQHQTRENIGQEEYKKNHREWLKTHLHHLAFALRGTLNELESGGRHRSKYFQEVKNVLENKCHASVYLKEFCGKLQSGGSQPLDVEKLTNLIGHLSNLELKPLRKYFNNDEKHKTGDYWDEGHLKGIFDNWIIREWRINPEKDKDKGKDKKGDYKKLCEDWKSHKGGVVDFWLKNDPFKTIPPYQDNNNRHPPRCQSLILNAAYLDNKYPDWQNWLEQLLEQREIRNYLENYKSELKDLKSGEGKSYFSDEITGKLKKDSGRRTYKNLDARILQFIFDRVKADDPLNLNEIYSQVKKYRQRQSTELEKGNAKDKLEAAIKNSKLPDTLKTPRDYQNSAVFEQGTFLHLTCKYYKIRQKAKDGRLYIHPQYRYVEGRGYENTGRFDDKDHLLNYCNHKPRQKRHQMLSDLAGLLQVAPKQLEELVQQQNGRTIDEKLFGWLDNIDNLKTNCEQAATEQKKRRGRLKPDIQEIFGFIYHRRQSTSPSAGEIKAILKNSQVDEASKLHSFCKRAKSLCLTVTKPLYDTSKQKQWQQELDNNPATAVYLLAQVNNLAFKERSGNANTCAVCSTDNAQRMQMITSKNGKESGAKAQRLPAIETRLIDGAVMRMARIVGGAIAKDKWQKVELELKKNNQVHIPIITESNRFEFEPSREELVKNQRTKPREGKVLERDDDPDLQDSNPKNQRIKDACRICPYEGESISGQGEIDHIIPRRSEWGTLNDEANLIWASCIGNQHKSNQDLSLEKLKLSYKNELFEGKNDQEIEDWIIEQIGDSESEEFKFGQYRSFINLSPDEQKAFRHALFLVGHPLRKRVINAIDNRNRAFVNGTQRYFAEVLANNLYKKTKAIGKQHLLSFDYFGVNSNGTSNNISVPFVRQRLENKKDEQGNFTHPELQKHKKGNGSQTTYSHLVDAQLAFLITASKHFKEGSIRLQENDLTFYEFIDKDGEVKDPYKKIKVDDATFPGETNLERRPVKANKKQGYQHRPLFNNKPGGWHFLKLIEIETNDKKYYLKGFLDLGKLKSCLGQENWQGALAREYGDTHKNKEKEKFYSYGQLLNENESTSFVDLYNNDRFGYQGEKRLWPKVIFDNHKLDSNIFTVRLHQIDKTKAAEFLLNTFNTASDSKKWEEGDCQTLDLLSSLWYHTKRNKIGESNDIEYELKDFEVNKLLNISLFKAWRSLKKSLQDSDAENFQQDLKNYFLVEGRPKNKHQKVRKDFSLPKKSIGQGWFLLRRTTKTPTYKELIYQCLSESNDISKFVKTEQESKVLSAQYRNKNLFLFANSKDLKKYLSSLNTLKDPNEWNKENIPEKFEDILMNIEKKVGSDNSRPFYRLSFKERPEFDNEFINFIKDFARPRGVSKKVLDQLVADLSWSALAKMWDEELKKDIENLEKQSKLDPSDERIKNCLKEKRSTRKAFNTLKELHNKIENNMLEYQKG